MYAPSSVNVMPFDPLHGAGQAKAYATKYASKPEVVGDIRFSIGSSVV